MNMMSLAAAWSEPPSANVGVVIVTSTLLPRNIIDQVRTAIDDWDQVAFMVVDRPTELLHDWLQPRTSPYCQAKQLLQSISRNCFILDIEVETVPTLAWLGSVCGHKLQVIRLGVDGPSGHNMGQQVEEILSAARSIVRSLLQERYML